MSKRGLSFEEKKAKMLEIFHENGEFFTIKELEKIAPRTKGIVQQTVKDVLNDLTGDSLVQFDKIGTGNYYWSFPSAAGAMKQAALTRAQQELETTDTKIAESRAGLREADKGREDTLTCLSLHAERRKLLATLAELNAASAELKGQLAAFGAADPVRYERKKRAIQVAKEAAVRWTDNTVVVMQYTQNLGMEADQLRGFLGISEEWDDVTF